MLCFVSIAGKTSGILSRGIVFLSGLRLDAFTLSFHVHKSNLMQDKRSSECFRSVFLVRTLRAGRCKKQPEEKRRDVNVHGG